MGLPEAGNLIKLSKFISLAGVLPDTIGLVGWLAGWQAGWLAGLGLKRVPKAVPEVSVPFGRGPPDCGAAANLL